jgi:hypothetical protein
LAEAEFSSRRERTGYGMIDGKREILETVDIDNYLPAVL